MDATRLLDLLYLMLPAYLANMAPPFTRFWKGWNRPISVRLLGSHKTVLGFALGVATALLVTALQARFAPARALIDYSQWPLAGLAFGFGAMGGDCLKSLFKRRLGVAPGARWIPLDQLDFALGSLLLIAPLASLRWPDVLAILSMTLVGDLAVNRVSYWLRIKDTPW
jgi:CDP-2,3-bis-(O-geranylgeranyl)-sn-glycerol synthase